MKGTARTSMDRLYRESVLLLAISLLAGCSPDRIAEPPAGKLDPVRLNFGQVFLGQVADRTFTLHNAGRGALTGTIHTSCPEFAVVTGGGAYSLDADQAREVMVRFQPTSAGNKTCTISTENSTFGTMVCSGTGVEIPVGACCDVTGSCSVTTELDCQAPRAWHGAGTDCDPNPCPQPTGSCCSLEGACVVVPEADCAAPSIWTMFADCDPNPCAQPTGSCCALEGTCAVTIESECALPSIWTMFADCDPNPCVQPTGSCCAPEGACTVTIEPDCAAPSIWMMFADCDPNPCVQPTGSCCAPDGVCALTMETACPLPNVWTMFADCDPNPCVQPTGSCCALDGTCTVTLDATCASPDIWTMFGDCDPNPCLQPTGSCCALDGTCTVTLEATCASPDIWTMFGDCDPNPCEQPTGSCCALDGTCSVTMEAGCASPSIWTLLADCIPNPCEQPTGSCCAPDGVCAVETHAGCVSPNVWTMFADCDPNPCIQPTGACCAFEGACTITTEAECAAPSAWQGDGTDCTPNPCPKPTGACCTQNGACFVTIQTGCMAPYTWSGPDTDCSPNPCPQPTGACCATSGACTVTTQAACVAPSVWRGAGTVCSPNPCPQPTGACCTPSDACSITTQASCVSPSIWMGIDTDCLPNPCMEQPTGACCTPAGACSVTTQANCITPNAWQGAGTDCSPNPCVQEPMGACCAPTGTCTITTQSACVSPNTWQGAGTGCSPNPCVQQPTGACCMPSGACWLTTETSCVAPNVWQGTGTDCSPNPCPQPPTGACCTPTGSCSVTTQPSCAAPNVWQGAGSDCSPNPCPQPPTGACCTPAGACTVKIEVSCAAPNVWQGAGTDCSPNPCPQPPTGACCTPAGACSVTIQASCVSPNIWQGADTDCSPNPCPQPPTGACCTPTGNCSITIQASCGSPNAWQGADTDCSPNPCPPPTITLSPSSLPNGTLGIAYNQTITASGGTAPYTFVVSLGILPTGLGLSSGGALAGTPSETGDFSFTVQATDAWGFTGSRAYAMTVAVGGGVDLTMPTVYITQSTQALAFDVPLVAYRNGFLRAFAVADGANSLTPQVRVRIYDGGSLIQTYTISAPGASVPTSVDESILLKSWNQAITGTNIQPGYSLLVDVDPNNLIPEDNESNNVWPASGTPHPLDVRDLPILDMTLVPVNTPAGTGNVNAGNAASFMDYVRRLHPIPDYDVQVRATLNSTANLLADGTGWDQVLNEVTAQRTADGSSRYYFGVVHVTYGSGVAGLGWIGYPVAIGWDYLPSGSWTLAHEIGHNWNYGHTQCTGGESGVDPNYPYPGGAIGVYGYDLWASSLKDKTTYKDIMSYCSTKWISDYTYKKILDFREGSPIGFRQEAGEEPCLLVWGLRRNGAWILEPSFLLSTRPSSPRPGPYRVEGLDASGSVLWSQEFDVMQSSHPTDPTSAGFCFAVPMSAALLEPIEVLRVVDGQTELARRESAAAPAPKGLGSPGAEVGLTRRAGGDVDLVWDAARTPVVMVRDVDGGACLGFARGGRAHLSASTGQLELLLSDGVHTRVQRWP